MKKIFVLIAFCIVLLAGCKSDDPSSTSVTQSNEESAQEIDDTDDTDSTDNSDSTDNTPAVLGDLFNNKGDTIEITEKLFIAQTNDIYVNTDEYIGKTIKYEGIFTSFEYEETGNTYYYVIRYGPGCCGYDANAGFEVTWSGDYPNQNDWVEAVGVLEEYEEDGYNYLRLNLSSLTVLDTRGEEYVYQ